MPTLWTVGHSTRPLEEFLELLQAHGIRTLADVRIIPYSRHNPQFHTATLAQALQATDIQYCHILALGGRRKARPDSPNLGWRNEMFRGYADYMETAPFQVGLAELLQLADTGPTAIMCAEAVPWRCHRSLIADALVVRGWTVRHILTSAKADPHQLTPFAEWKHGILSYPKPAGPESPPRLF